MEGRSLVKKERGLEFAESIGAELFQVSAMKGTEVNNAFQAVARKFYEMYMSKVTFIQSIIS